MMFANSVNLDRKCRLCASDLLDLNCAVDIFSGIALDEKIKRYLYITVDQNDDLPKVICATCFIKIESIDKFAYLATKTEETFVTWIKRAKEMNLIPYPPPGSSIHRDHSSDPHSPSNKIILNTYRNPRNPRHVDHITLEQIINDQIVRNPKLFTTPPPAPQAGPPPMTSQEKLVIAYHDLKIGQLIKDEELLKLMLKALKWMELGSRRFSAKYWLKKLKGSKFREVLSNQNLLNDADLMQLIKSYMGQDALTLLNLAVPSPSSKTTPSSLLDDDVTRMEVGVDPSLFLDDADSRTNTPEIRNDGKFLCTICPETFLLSTDLQNHVLTHLIAKQPVRKRQRKSRNGVLQDSGNLPSSSSSVVAKKTRGVRKKKPTETPEDAENLPAEPAPNFSGLIRIPPQMNPALLELATELQNEEKAEKAAKPKRRRRKQVAETSPSPAPAPTPTPTSTPTPTPTLKEKKRDEVKALVRRRKKLSGKSPSKAHPKAEKKTAKFACDTCQKVFASKSNLMGHILSHALEKRSHKCPTCRKTFNKSKDLKVHVATHSSDRPWNCTFCEKSFLTSGNLATHEKRMHADLLSKKSNESPATTTKKTSV